VGKAITAPRPALSITLRERTDLGQHLP
jgi:hypothetical protein